MSRFNKRLKELRKRKGLSQQQLADILRISKSSVNMYERGEREPSIDTLEAIADHFNVDMDYLLGKTNIPRANSIVPEKYKIIVNSPKVKRVFKNRRSPANLMVLSAMQAMMNMKKVHDIKFENIKIDECAKLPVPHKVLEEHEGFKIIKLYGELDETDKGKVIERMETMLEADKYSKKVKKSKKSKNNSEPEPT